MWIALLRHGVTEWNERGIIQGRTDIPLSAAGQAKLTVIRPCEDFLRARWVTSPLQRAVQTAAALNGAAEIHPALIETNWGKFEGIRRADLRAEIKSRRLTPDHGLDFCPPDGESMRDVRRRLLRWFAETVPNTVTPVVAVTHKGVIRSVLSAACDWDMREEFQPKPDWSLPHIFAFADDRLRLVKLNCPWSESPATFYSPNSA